MSKADELKAKNENLFEHNTILLNENERLKKENAGLKATLTAGSMFNKSLNADNKYLTEERDKYRNMVFDTKDQLAQAKKIIKGLLSCCRNYPQENAEKMEQAEEFIKE
jgi:predicted nuclease with TOPRIM domain